MSLVLITPPAERPVSVDEIVTQLRMVDGNRTEEINLQIERMIDAAAHQVENTKCWIQLISATYELRLDAFPCSRMIRLPKPPLQSVTSVKYIDTDGVLQTMSSADYVVETWRGTPSGSDPFPAVHEVKRGEIRLGYNEYWPYTRNEPGAVRIRFVAGFSDTAADIPGAIKQWISVAVATMFEHREREIAGAGMTITKFDFVDGLLDPFSAKERVRG